MFLENDLDDPDFILTGKSKDEGCDGDCKDQSPALNFLDLLDDNHDERLDYSLYETQLTGCIGEWLQHKRHEKPDVMPYISIVDLNNSEDAPYENKPKKAIEAGVKISF